MKRAPVIRSLRLLFLSGVLLVAPRTAAATQPHPQSVAAQASPGVTTSRPAGETVFLPDAETALLGLLNQTRRARGLPRLAPSAPLRVAARSHSREMALSGVVGHGSALLQSFLDRLSGLVRPGTLAGENVGCATSVGRVEAAFEASPGHLDNMLNPRFGTVGIGIATSPLGLMVTEDFAE
ncbi:MAG TPA: CAP domain-containing protein [Tepidiformaceae bacterium]|nr:CAP domain-containing protein [Tepidiformaceae bacterium]